MRKTRPPPEKDPYVRQHAFHGTLERDVFVGHDYAFLNVPPGPVTHVRKVQFNCGRNSGSDTIAWKFIADISNCTAREHFCCSLCSALNRMGGYKKEKSFTDRLYTLD